jgi:hypothetical protein
VFKINDVPLAGQTLNNDTHSQSWLGLPNDHVLLQIPKHGRQQPQILFAQADAQINLVFETAYLLVKVSELVVVRAFDVLADKC